MSSAGMVWARQQAVGKMGAKFCLVVLGELVDDEGKTTRSQGYIAKIMECTPTAVGVNLGYLEDRGFIKRERRMGGNKRLSDTTYLAIPGVFSVDNSEPPVSGDTDSEPPVSGASVPPVSGEHKDKHLTTNLKKPEAKASGGEAPAEAPVRTAQTLLAEWIDACNPKPPSRVKGQMAREIGNLLGEGIDYDAVRDGLILLHQRGAHPSTLPSFVHSVQQRPSVTMKPSGNNPGAGLATGTQRAMEAVAAGRALQAEKEHQALALEGTAVSGRAAGRAAIGTGGLGGQPQGGRDDDSGVVGNPRPYRVS